MLFLSVVAINALLGVAFLSAGVVPGESRRASEVDADQFIQFLADLFITNSLRDTPALALLVGHILEMPHGNGELEIAFKKNPQLFRDFYRKLKELNEPIPQVDLLELAGLFLRRQALVAELLLMGPQIRALLLVSYVQKKIT